MAANCSSHMGFGLRSINSSESSHCHQGADKSIGSPTENLLRVHLVSPDLEVGKLGFAVDGGKGAIHGVRTVGDFDAADARDIEARVEGQPLLSKINFAAGMEIHRRARIDTAVR